MVDHHASRSEVDWFAFFRELSGLQQQSRKLFSDLLSDEQFAEFRRFQNEVCAGAADQVTHTLSETMIQKLREPLGLTEEQGAQMLPVIQRDLARRRELLLGYSGGGLRQARTMRKKSKELDTDTERALEGILSKEQLQQYKKNRDERRKQMRKMTEE